jgi:hypothetical protein
MSQQDYAAALPGDLKDRRRNGADAGVVGNSGASHWHIQVDADQHTLTVDVNVVKGAEGGHQSSSQPV